jgi:hypothetical protein
MKFLKLGASLLAIVFLGLEILYLVEWRDTGDTWLMAPPPLVLLWPLSRWLRRRFTKATVSGDRLRFEMGAVSKTTRNIQLSKLQDARVEQRFLLTIPNVDDPQALADEIMNRAQGGPGAPGRAAVS